MKNFFLPLLGIILLTFHSSNAQENLSIKLSSEKNTFLLGEPVVVLVEVTNRSATPFRLVGGVEPEFDMLHYQITNPDGTTGDFSPLYVADTDKVITLEKNQSHYGVARVFYGGNGYTFTKPGNYKITARYKNFRSNTLQITVAEPSSDAELEQARLILDNNEVGLFLMLEGGDELKQAHQVRKELETRYPNSLLVAYLKYAQGKNLSVPARNFVSKQPRKADLNQAVELLSGVVESSILTYYRVKTAATLATCYQKLGKIDEARKVLQGMEQQLNRDKRLAPYFSTEVASMLNQLK